MNEHQDLLDEALSFCDPTTGEVVELIPEELMRRLRAAKLAVGIPREVSRTTARAKWIVFLNTEIRDQAVTQWRATKHQRQRTKRGSTDARAQVPSSEVEPPVKTVGGRGLHGFLRPKKPDA
jgi:hypothetical protein